MLVGPGVRDTIDVIHLLAFIRVPHTSMTSTIFSRARIIGLLVLALLVMPTAAFAQEKVSIKVQPSLIEEKVDPGQVLSRAVEVTNFSSISQILYLSVKDISSVNDDGQPTFSKVGETTPYDVSSWISFSAPSVTLAPGESRKVPFLITVPSQVSPGGHYGGVIFQQNPPDLTTSGTGVGYEVAMLLSMRVSGDIKEDAQVRDFQTEKMIYGKTPVKFLVRVENPGNVIVRPRGPIDLVNMFGKKVDTIRMNDAAAAVFPGQIRPFEAEWDSANLLFGRYTATLVLAYGDDGKQSTTPVVTRLWILPTSIIIPASIFLIFFVLLTWILMRLYVAKRLRELSSYAPRGGVSSGGGGGMSRLTAVTIALLSSIVIMLGALFLFF
jgi:hypothetical protein